MFNNIVPGEIPLKKLPKPYQCKLKLVNANICSLGHIIIGTLISQIKIYIFEGVWYLTDSLIENQPNLQLWWKCKHFSNVLGSEVQQKTKSTYLFNKLILQKS